MAESQPDEYTPADATDPHMAAYVISLLDRRLGFWDDRYIRVVTGYGWEHWEAIFAGTKWFEAVFRGITTQHYLVEGYRYSEVKDLADQYTATGGRI